MYTFSQRLLELDKELKAKDKLSDSQRIKQMDGKAKSRGTRGGRRKSPSSSLPTTTKVKKT